MVTVSKINMRYLLGKSCFYTPLKMMIIIIMIIKKNSAYIFVPWETPWSRSVSDILVRSGISTGGHWEWAERRREREGINTEGSLTQSVRGTAQVLVSKMRTSKILVILALSVATANATLLEKKLFLIHKLKQKLGKPSYLVIYHYHYHYHYVLQDWEGCFTRATV